MKPRTPRGDTGPRLARAPLATAVLLAVTRLASAQSSAVSAPGSPTANEPSARGAPAPTATNAQAPAPQAGADDAEATPPAEASDRGQDATPANTPETSGGSAESTLPRDSASPLHASASTPAAPPADRNAAGIDADADAAITALVQEGAAGDVAASDAAARLDEEGRLALYGFADFNYTRQLTKTPFFYPYSSFAIGNLNLYVGSELGDDWRFLTEIRFTYLPHGVELTEFDGEGDGRTDTLSPDYAEVGGESILRWGSIEIERAWIEYAAHELLTIRLGQWLSPYGIWNVDHGSPTIIAVHRPFVITQGLIPERQTGIELHGHRYFDATRVGYHATISNGRGPVDAYRDYDENKAVGGRLFAETDGKLGTLALGVSGYWGRYTDRSLQYSLDGSQDGAPPSLTAERPVIARYDELSFATDLKWQWGQYLLQSEFIVNDAVYDDDARPAESGWGPRGFAADYRRWGGYALTGYRMRWLGTMPFVGYERFRHPYLPAQAVWLGLNIRPTPRVVVKAQYTHAWFEDLSLFGLPIPDANYLEGQLAWSF